MERRLTELQKLSQCQLPKNFYHPNIYPSGTVCLDIINEGEGWRPSITVKQILLGIQDLLDTPNNLSPANGAASSDYQRDRTAYRRKVLAQTRNYPPP